MQEKPWQPLLPGMDAGQTQASALLPSNPSHRQEYASMDRLPSSPILNGRKLALFKYPITRELSESIHTPSWLFSGFDSIC